MAAPTLYAVLLAGGSGTRFWPASRAGKPKQFLAIAGQQSMLAETAARLEALVPRERVLVVSTGDQAAWVRECLPWIERENLLLEPLGRNTAPAIAWAALEIERRDPDALQVVLPADHVIRPREAFQRTLRAATQAALDRTSLVVFGIRPSFPATAFGWIRAGEVLARVDGLDLFAVQRFVEKPELARAQQFLADGGYYWNSGMFVWSSAAIRAALARHVPELAARLTRAPARDFASTYAALETVAFDVAVLERAENVRMLPIDYFWSDVGSWDALQALAPPDAQGNSCVGGASVVALDSSRCIVHAPSGQLIALIGVEDLIVVQAGDATLVCKRERAQDVKTLVERLRVEQRSFL
jgi:mannose-1-phosphate guanylyltransferase